MPSTISQIQFKNSAFAANILGEEDIEAEQNFQDTFNAQAPPTDEPVPAAALESPGMLVAQIGTTFLRQDRDIEESPRM